MGGIYEERIWIKARDNRPLSAVLIRPATPSRVVVFSPGTAVSKEAYVNFARSGAARGFAVLLYDYRSQGASLTGAAKDETSDFLDWGKLDLTGAIETAYRLFPRIPIATMGHSAGGQILGLADNQARCDRHVFIAVCWPYWRDKSLSFVPAELLFWYGYGPACIKLFGHLPKGGLWRGESLNPKLFRMWKRWCTSPEPSDLQGYDYEAVKSPIAAFGFVDDPIATKRNTPKMLRMFANAPCEEVWLDPARFGLRHLGHQGVFSRAAKAVWTTIWDGVESTQGDVLGGLHGVVSEEPESERRLKLVTAGP